MRPLIIVGAGGHGREALDIVEACNGVKPQYELAGFVDDGSVDESLLAARGAPLLGPVARLASFEADYVIGIGSPEIRARIDELAGSWGRSAATLVHPAATIGARCHLEPGCVVAAGARITTNVRLGRHVHVNVNATISHDCVIDDYTTIAPGAHLSGQVTVGAGTWIGAGAVAIQGITIQAGSTVGAGACTVDDVAAGTTVVGVPARPIDQRA